MYVPFITEPVAMVLAFLLSFSWLAWVVYRNTEPTTKCRSRLDDILDPIDDVVTKETAEKVADKK